MERKFLEELGLEKDTADKIMGEHGKSVQTLQGASEGLKTANTEITRLTGLIETANLEIKGFKDLDVEGIQKKIKDYEADIIQKDKDHQTEMESIKYNTAVSEFASNLPFSSSYAKRGFIEEFKGKGFKLEDDKFLGADDYVKQIKEKNPETFQADPAGGAGFDGTNPINNGAKGFSFDFQTVRPEIKGD